MKIGVCLVTYNRKLFTEQAIKSLLWSKPEDVSMVIVDNNSTDGTQEMLTGYQAANVIIKQVIYNPENKYSGYTINQGFEILSKYCDIIGSMANDFMVEPRWDRNILACMEEMGFEYVIGSVRPDRENIKKVTPSGYGHYTKPRDPGACTFLKTGHWLNGFRMSSVPWGKDRIGPMPEFHHALKSLKGARLASPGFRVRKSEYTNPGYIEYYNKTFGERGIMDQLIERRKLESEGTWAPNALNWKQFLKRYYPDGRS